MESNIEMVRYLHKSEYEKHRSCNASRREKPTLAGFLSAREEKFPFKTLVELMFELRIHITRLNLTQWDFKHSLHHKSIPEAKKNDF